MIYFDSDYLEGAHPQILQKLTETNFEQTYGYGEDMHCERARRLIQNAIGTDCVDVRFLVGGTQTNQTVIATLLKPYQGVVCSQIGHINVHETGAIEATGHKVIGIPSTDGKLHAEALRDLLEENKNDPTKEHTVEPKAVYVSFPAENGALYSKQELTELSEVCKTYGCYFYLDGARLGYGLTAETNDVALSDLARLCDIFYIGGTKCGALFGEAVVIVNQSLKRDFAYMIKRQGGRLAKGRLLGIQFEALFTDDLYFTVCQKANRQAYTIRDAFVASGYPVAYPSFTNQQFFTLPNVILKQLSNRFSLEQWAKPDREHTTVRICTSWATPNENVEELIRSINSLSSACASAPAQTF